MNVIRWKSQLYGRMLSRKVAGRILQARAISTGNLYVHRTVAEFNKRSAAAVTLGLFSSLKELRPGLGYFRPIDDTTVEGRRAELVRCKFKLGDELSSMQGVSQTQAYELLANDNADDLLEQIFLAYETYRKRHDFVMIEGTHLDSLWEDTVTLNADIASALGSPVFLATDASEVVRGLENHLDWRAEVAKYTRLTALSFKKVSVGIAGAVVYRTPTALDISELEALRKLFSRWELPLAGFISPHSMEAPDIGDVKTLFEVHINSEVLERAVTQEDHVSMSPLLFKNSIMLKAKENKQVILLPEGDEPRTVEAAGFILKHGLCNLILLGNRDEVLEVASTCNVDLSSAVIRDPTDPELLEKYADVYFKARAHKGMTIERAREALRNDPIILGTCMVAAGDADGMVSGAIHTTANTVRPALQIIKTEHDKPIVSSVFFICLRNKVVVYADVAINTNPSPEELATIAISSADTATAFGIEPRVALLSYATGDSNAGPLVQKVVDAVALARSKRPDLLIEGPLQYDAAVNPLAAKIKLKGKSSAVAGDANVFIFPDLNSSNIACKAVQQHTGAVAIGPVLQGLRKPINDLSRGCTVKDIIATIATTAVQASEKQKSSRLKEQVELKD